MKNRSIPISKACKSSVSGRQLDRLLFDNLPRLMRPEQVAAHFDVSIKTIYDWRHRGSLRGIPQGMFLSLNRRLFIRTDIFVDWIASQNPDLNVRE
ncbi:MAG: helix-turn-helix domain-containing protein [Proteobacteria bacterium]|nr:helix-turn-helix domain-containing protein [Pseudomonadota bacterium]